VITPGAAARRARTRRLTGIRLATMRQYLVPRAPAPVRVLASPALATRKDSDMNDTPDRHTGGSRAPQRHSRLWRAGVLAAATVAVVLLATACGGGQPTAAAPATAAPAAAAPATAASATATTATAAPTTAAPTTAAPTTAARRTYQAALSYAQCMRAHGARNWPDPRSDGYFAGNIDVGGSQYLSANAACGHLLPNGGVLSRAQIQQNLSALSKYAACMRTHGIPGFPDPDLRAVEAGYTWAGSVSMGALHTTAQQFNSTNQACRGFLPGYSRAP
jgi:hypothetical protein